MSFQESEYRRKIRQRYERLRPAGNESPDPSDFERRWRKKEVCGLWAAALVGVIAIIVGNLDASHQSTILSQQMAEMQAERRAFVVVDSVTITRSGDDKVLWEIRPAIKNAGLTPTRNMVFTPVYMSLVGERNMYDQQFPGVTLPNVPEDPAFSFYVLGAKDTPYVMAFLGPQATLPITSIKGAITQSLIDRAKGTGPAALFVSGAVKYSDVFPGSPRHITKYCYIVDPAKGGVDVCGAWNCADDECRVDAETHNQSVEAAFRKAGKTTHPSMLVPTMALVTD